MILPDSGLTRPGVGEDGNTDEVDRGMRELKHLSPMYVRARLVEMADHHRHPADPWLTRQAIEILKDYLKPTDRALETGSGRSTVWFAQRVGALTSIEHNREWYRSVQASLREGGFGHVDYRLFERSEEREDADQDYVRFVAGLEPESLDFALIDGVYRDQCARHAIRKLRHGGMLAIDNVNWFLPSDSKSPNSRRPGQAAPSAVWAEVEEELRRWRRIWTSSGVTDTALFVKT